MLRKRRRRVTALLLTTALVLPAPVFAHNEPVHQRMTDYAYEVLLAAGHTSAGGPISGRLLRELRRLRDANPALTVLYADAHTAIPKLRSLKSGLPFDGTPCATQVLANLFGPGAPPDWNLSPGAFLMDLPMSQVRLPVTVHYGHGPVICGIDEKWNPSGVLASVNPGSFTSRDHTGVTLGHWAAAPDLELKDWVLRSTTLETLQNPVVVGGIGVGVTVAVSAACVIACGFFPVLCALCPVLGVGAGGVVIDEITSIDASALESDKFVGFGHFIDMKPTPASPFFFDGKPGKLAERAGPAGVPDVTEDAVTLLFDLGGIHVNHDQSEAPKNYEIILGSSGAIGDDFHRNTTDRSQSEWETPTVPHLQLTAVDNLGMFGYQEAKAFKGSSVEARRLGWPLHAIADAAVPMHAVGASGYGHRPYEDAVDMAYEDLVASNDTTQSISAVTQVLLKAQKWRQFIQDWRALRGTTEVPVRDLVTAVAAAARQKGIANPAVFKPNQSLLYLVDEDAATAAYLNPGMAAIQRDLLLEGIAAEVAFLISLTEVIP